MSKVVYVGALHVPHHRNAKDALLAGKHVLLEKPACLEVKELDELSKIAKEKNLFNDAELCGLGSNLSPNAVEEVIKSDILGKPKRFSADFSMDVNLDALPNSSRMINPALGGGSLLDMSAYPSVWAMLLVHRHPLNSDKDPKVLLTHQTIYPRSGVDSISSVTKVIWIFPHLLPKQYSLTIRDILHLSPTSRFPGHKDTIASFTTRHHPFHDGDNVMPYEANEVARCIRDGKIVREDATGGEQGGAEWVDMVRKEGPSETAKLVGTAGQ
ncbi:hypothetical protein D1P53_001025 [Cryptococcus gattii VGV]|nr:hypothetical protein D1P53_001025 [Cryptococcus gattii VGV]